MELEADHAGITEILEKRRPFIFCLERCRVFSDCLQFLDTSNNSVKMH